MTRIFDATCVAGVVKVEGIEIPDVEIITQGTKSSTGILILNGNEKKYVTANTTDIVDFLDEVAGVLNTIATTLTAIGSGMTGPTTAPPGTLATSVTQIQTVATALDAMKENLK